MNTCNTCKVNKVCDHYRFGFENCESYISENAVEVVRCKDCRNFMRYTEEYRQTVEKADGDCYIRFINNCDKSFLACQFDDFCSYGKRMGDG